MKILRSLNILGLLVLVAAAVTGLVLTRDTGQRASVAPGRRAPLVDEKPLQTAQAMAKLVSDRDEQRLAQQALKLANHEVDLAFADALRDATEQPTATTAQGRALYARVEKAQAVVQADQAHIDEIKKRLGQASSAQQNSLQQELSILQAQIGLDQDELADAQEDLSRSGLDPLSRIQRQFTRHQTAQSADSGRGQTSPDSSPAAAADLVGRIAAWRAAQSKLQQLQAAQNDASNNAATLGKAHDDLEKQVAQEQADQQSLSQAAAAELASGPREASAGPSGETAAALFSLHAIAVDQKDLADLDKRIRDETELRDAYGSWIVLVKSDQREALHGILKSALYITLIILGMYLAGLLVEHFFSGLSPEQMRLRTLRIITRLAFRTVGLILILLVIFGVPNQLTTVLGLAGAGLTVALQDFIISFFGWFALMGRNGIRVGDWVEINGVTGEVIEIGLLRTVLLETGNWADAGHPTGRKITMMNSYAIQGRYFNFSTSGQWLWDEVQIVMPLTEDPYPIIEAVQQIVVKETADDTRAAQQEWKQTTRRYRVNSASAEPAINLRPTAEGLEIHVRYVTRANERYIMRTRLYQGIVDMLHRRGVEATNAPVGSEKN